MNWKRTIRSNGSKAHPQFRRQLRSHSKTIQADHNCFAIFALAIFSISNSLKSSKMGPFTQYLKMVNTNKISSLALLEPMRPRRQIS
jgi:hypothetical protein